jgi:hypothetical protein
MSQPAAPVFISWIHHQGRSTDLAAALGAEAVFVNTGSILNPRTAPFRHLANGARTVLELLRRRPSAVIVMAPPLPAIAVCWAWCRVTRRPLVIDMHTGVFNDPKWSWARRPTWWLARRARLSVVTNQILVDQLAEVGIPAAAIDNPPLRRRAPVGAPPGGDRGSGYVLVPCSYSSDEPVEAIIEAGRHVPDVEILLTGRPPAKVEGRAAEVPNIRLTGFVDNDTYEGLLAGAGAVLCLTTRRLTMQQGGYEALAAGIPLVTSDFPVLRGYFTGGTVFTAPEPEIIASAIREALRARSRLAEEMADLRNRKQAAWPTSLEPLRAALQLDEPRR